MDDYPRFDSDEPEYNEQDYDTKLHTTCQDDVFTRRVRPASIVLMLVFFVFIVLADGNLGSFKVVPGYYPIIETIIATMIFAYFGSRGIEKSFRSWERGQYHMSRPTRRSFRRPRMEDEEDYRDREEYD